MARMVADEAPSFDAFVVGHTSDLLRFAYVLTGEMGRAEDLLQEALIKAYRRWDRVRAADRPEAYLRRVLANEYVSWNRRRRNTEVPASIPDTASSYGTEAAVVERDALWQALRRLSPRQRAVLVLRFYEDLPEAQIAQALGCTGGTVRSLTTRALHQLRNDPLVAAGGSTGPRAVTEES